MLIKRIKDYIFPSYNEIMVSVENGKRQEYEKGKVVYRTADEMIIELKYENRGHNFRTKQSCIIDKYKGYDVVPWVVGSDVSSNFYKHESFASAENGGSELQWTIFDSRIVNEMLKTNEDLREGKGINWKPILWIGGIAIIIAVLWFTGILPGIISDMRPGTG